VIVFLFLLPHIANRFSLQIKPGGLVRVHTSVLQPMAQYKSLMISEVTTCDELLTLLLSCYNLHEPVEQFSLYEVGNKTNGKFHVAKGIKSTFSFCWLVVGRAGQMLSNDQNVIGSKLRMISGIVLNFFDRLSTIIAFIAPRDQISASMYFT
jgi:Ras association (RalGDS/AF-6) domain